MSKATLTLFCLFCLLFSLDALAQRQDKINPMLHSYLETVRNPDELTALAVRGGKQIMREFAETHDGVYKGSAGGYHFIGLPARHIRDFARLDAVQYIEFNLHRGQTMNEEMRINNRINDAHNGVSPLPDSLTGKGVVMGFIDTGAEINHPDFTDTANQQTRIIYIWDHTESDVPAQIPPQYGYGKVWDSTHINTGVCTHVDGSGHGSTVTGTGAGNGNAGAEYKGVAPESDIIIVESNFAAPNWLQTIADATEYIYAMADSLGKPCVINASLGTYYGAHDGRDAAALRIDSLTLAKPGRAFVCAAGNAGGLPMHLGYDVTADTSFTWFELEAANQNPFPVPAVYFEGWSDTADFNQVWLAIGADNPATWEHRGNTAFYNPMAIVNTTVIDTIWNNGNVLGVAEIFVGLDGDRYFFSGSVVQPDSAQYNFSLMTTGAGHLDIWGLALLGTSDIVGTGLPTVAQMPEIVNYQLPDANQTIVSSWNCSDHVISVGNWVGRTTYVDMLGDTNTVGGVVGEIFAGSSEGPTRDNRIKPDVAATGQIMLSTGSYPVIAQLIANNASFVVAPTQQHIRNGGTSMASPVVAGIAALYFQLCPDATAAEVKAAILNTARADTSTGTTPNNTWGSGKVDGFAALVTSVFTPTVTANPDTQFCVGDSIELQGPAGMSSYQWSTGATTPSIWVSTTDTISLSVTDSMGCAGMTDDYYTIAHPLPVVPIITQVGDTLATDSSSAYQWYLDGSPITGANGQTHQAQSSGIYHVVVENQFGCSAESDTIYLSLVGIPESAQGHFSVYPNPTRSAWQLMSGDNQAGDVEVILYDASGRVVFTQRWLQLQSGASLVLPAQSLARGTYYLEVKSDHYRWYRRLMRQ